LYKSNLQNRQLASPNKIIRDSAFASRLAIACDNHPDCPPLNYGRLRWIVGEFKRLFNITTAIESVRKWHAGEVRPRPNAMRMLAEILDCDERWLSVGDLKNQQWERERRKAIVSGGVNVVAGMIALDGGHPSFPEPDDKTARGVDIYAIVKGAHYRIKVAAAESKDNGLKFEVPANYGELFVVGLIRKGPFNFDLIELDADTISKHRGSKSGPIMLEVEKRGQSYAIGDDRLKSITNFAERP